MKINDLMTKDVVWCAPDDNVFEVAKVMASHDVGIVPILERDTRRPVGVITDRDIAIRVVAKGLDCKNTRANDFMSHDLVTCAPEDDVCDAEQRMQENQVRRILALDSDGSLAGIVSTGDLARRHELQHVGQTLQQISQPSGTSAAV